MLHKRAIMFGRVIHRRFQFGLPFRRMESNGSPPQHFGNPNYIPQTYSQTAERAPNAFGSRDSNVTDPATPPNIKDTRHSGDGIVKEITSLLAMCALAYLALDNYTSRITLEKQTVEAAAVHLKALQTQQISFLNARKKRDIQVLLDRKDNAKRDFKMGLHIALLRKQLIELGAKPIDIEAAIKEFEQNVRADNSIKNVNSQSLWLDDNSRMFTF